MDHDLNRLLYFLFGFILVGVLVALLWAAKTHEETVRSLPNVLARDFRPLLEGSLLSDINIGAIETEVKEIKRQYPFIEEIVVRKINQQNTPVTVYPYAYDLDHADPPVESDELFISKRFINEAGEAVGAIYIKINAQRQRLFYAAIAGSIVALALVIALGLYTIRSQEVEVRKTTTLLEEKQRELIHLERLAMVGQITANLLHDLKKPVLNIKAEAELLDNEETRKNIIEETDLFTGMLKELHLEGFLRKDHEHAEFLDIHEVLQRSLKLVKYAQEDVSVQIDLSVDLPFVFGQRHKMVQIFSNILLNAFQALEGKGAIHITASHSEEAEENWLEISIADDGPGMPYEVLEHIFEPFYSTHRTSDSTGLGLYITRSIVQSMGGSITAQSIPKHGTTFTVRFPISQEEAD